MSTPATTIDECIELTPNYVAVLTYEETHSLFTQFGLWTTGLFGPAGIFPPNPDAGAELRKIMNWYAQHIIARSEIEGPAIGDGGPVGVAAVINAITRVLYAIDEFATNAQKTLVIALFNACIAVGPEPTQQLGAWSDPFVFDHGGSPEAWDEYDVELIDPAQPAGVGWTVFIRIADPPAGAALEARVGETADAAGVWTPTADAIGVFIDSLGDYPTLQELADELLTVGVQVNDFGNLDPLDEIDGAAIIGTVPAAVFTLVPP